MIKMFKIGNSVTVVLSTGEVFTKSDASDEDISFIMDHLKDEEAVKALLIPQLKEVEETRTLLDKVDACPLLTRKGDSIYMEDISQLSLPKELIEAILEAYNYHDEDRLEAYKNFWTLLSMNPDSRCRQNLMWFLNRYGMRISKNGLFVGYRNADYKNNNSSFDKEAIDGITRAYLKVKSWKKSPKNYSINDDYEIVKLDEDNCGDSLYDLYQAVCNNTTDKDEDTTEGVVFTDHHSHTFDIRLGQIVSMPREKCDSCQEHSCSPGLHIGGANWLKENYFGEVGLMCLINPADVVAVPPIDDYGKLRTCAYYPVCTIDFDMDGDVIEPEIPDGFEDDFSNKIAYAACLDATVDTTYTVTVPSIPELNRSKIDIKLMEIAMKSTRRIY